MKYRASGCESFPDLIYLIGADAGARRVTGGLARIVVVAVGRGSSGGGGRTGRGEGDMGDGGDGTGSGAVVNRSGG